MIDNPASSKCLVIVNPNAGKGKGKKDWNLISSLLKKYDIEFKPVFTLAKQYAVKAVIDAISEGFRKIIVVGGDGTMNEVVNGAFLQDICPTSDIILGMIPVGTGNDWGKMFGIPGDYEKAVSIIKANKIRLQDAGLVYYFHGIERQKRYFINIAGLGFDAVVVKRTNLQKERGRRGKLLYFLNIVHCLFSYKHTHTEVVIDDKKISGKIFTISIGIGKYSGGGMMQTPDAIPDDGLFNITIIRNITRADIIISLKMLYDGTILNHPKIDGYKGKDILIDSDPLIHLEADGETLGHSPIEFRVIPSGINIFYDLFPQE